MASKKGVIGGFVASNTNTGEIEDCYCVTKFNGRQMTAGGFVGENAGKILTSFCQFISDGLSGGFCGKRSLISDDCYFVSDNNIKKRKAQSFWDNDHVLESGSVKNEADLKGVGFDSDYIWEYSGKKTLLKFQDENWFYNGLSQHGDDKIIHIKTEEDLISFAEMVNNGNIDVINSLVRLEDNIDLKGKAWTPIGINRANGFAGIFDGNGYTITNFVIKSEDYSKKGFFGYLRGKVYNLSIDCEIKGDGVIGAIAAVNEGEIGCCGVTIQCIGKGDELNVGGIVGTNSGRIFKSFAAGKIKFILIPIMPILILFSAMTVATATVVTIGDFSDDTIYNDMPADSEQEKWTDDYLDDSDKSVVVSDTNTISFTFYEEIDVIKESGECVLDFINPKSANHKLVVTLEMDEDEAKKAFEGENWDKSSCDREYGRVIIAKSGAVEPGYILKALTLNSQARMCMKSGKYKGYVVLYAYDADTSELSNVQTELPVELDVMVR